MQRLDWYWHRLRAMSPAEVAARCRKKLHQFQDRRGLPDWSGLSLPAGCNFPKLPTPEDAPAVLREALQRDAAEILKGNWKAFGYLNLRVEDPPQWHTDYLVRKNLTNPKCAFDVDHRTLPEGADIKLIWELSRWNELVRLGQAAFVLGDKTAAQTSVRWLSNWVEKNPPFTGWNWTSALEAGMRLIQFTWIDALLADTKEVGAALETVRTKILPPHVWFVSRYQSFGSSANNHLLGELAGLILALSRWPSLVAFARPLDELHAVWEREVLAQFAADGGNREQALNYHLFSWDFCWQSTLALEAAGKKVSTEVNERLTRAARFFCEVQCKRDPWDYGDSDDAFVTPFFCCAGNRIREWQDWVCKASEKKTFNYWLGAPPDFPQPFLTGDPLHAIDLLGWWYFRESGYAICESGFWFMRWDLSPLGYLATAAHGHLDALHLSIWHKGVAFIIDPGTGAYYGDKNLRAWLASRDAHNGPAPQPWQGVARRGPFLWAEQHEQPTISAQAAAVVGEFRSGPHSILRRISSKQNGGQWQIDDRCLTAGANSGFVVRWQFAPGSCVKVVGERKFIVQRNEVVIGVEAGPEWERVELVETKDKAHSWEGTVSPKFRKVEFAPFLRLTAPPGDAETLFTTTLSTSS